MQRIINSTQDHLLAAFFQAKKSRRLPAAPGDDALLLFNVILNFIQKHKWSYITDPSPQSIEEILASPEGTVHAVNCKDLAEIFRILCQLSQIRNVEVIEFNQRAGKEIGTKFNNSSPPIIPFDNNYDNFTDNQFLFLRHFVVKVGGRFYDLVFSTYYNNPDEFFDNTPYTRLASLIETGDEKGALALMRDDKTIDLKKTFVGLTLLHRAAMAGLPAVIKFLIGCGLDPSTLSNDSANIYAIENLPISGISDFESETFLLLSRNVPADKLALFKQTTVFNLAEIMITSGNFQDLATLIPELIDVNTQDSNGLTLLHIAMMNDRHDAAQWLIDNKADVTLCDSKGCVALQYMKIWGISHIDSDIFRMLSYKVNPAITNDIISTTKTLYRQFMQAALMIQAHKINHFFQIINKGLDINFTGSDGMTLLHYAARSNDDIIVEYLINSNIFVLDANGVSPLELCKPRSICYFLIKEYMEQLNLDTTMTEVAPTSRTPH